MKLCAACGTVSEDSCPHCDVCGEASWLEHVTAPSPESSEVTVPVETEQAATVSRRKR